MTKRSVVRTASYVIPALFLSDKFYSFLKIISKVIAYDIMILNNQAICEAIAISHVISFSLGWAPPFSFGRAVFIVIDTILHEAEAHIRILLISSLLCMPAGVRDNRGRIVLNWIFGQLLSISTSTRFYSWFWLKTSHRGLQLDLY